MNVCDDWEKDYGQTQAEILAAAIPALDNINARLRAVYVALAALADSDGMAISAGDYLIACVEDNVWGELAPWLRTAMHDFNGLSLVRPKDVFQT